VGGRRRYGRLIPAEETPVALQPEVTSLEREHFICQGVNTPIPSIQTQKNPGFRSRNARSTWFICCSIGSLGAIRRATSRQAQASCIRNDR
jgi:hypothetical protein